jgi:hypothetical protein
MAFSKSRTQLLGPAYALSASQFVDVTNLWNNLYGLSVGNWSTVHNKRILAWAYACNYTTGQASPLVTASYLKP